MHLLAEETRKSSAPSRSNRDRAETAHGVDEVSCARALHRGADLLDRVEDAGGGLAMHHGHVSETGLRGEPLGDRGRDLRFRRSSVSVWMSWMRAICDAAAVGAVDQDEQRPAGGMTEDRTDSMAKVPLPCISTHS